MRVSSGSPRRLHLMRGSCRRSAPEADLSRCVETLSEIERADGAGRRVGEVGEAPVAAHPLLTPGALVGLLDAEGAARQRLTRQLEHAEALGPLGLLEERDVDL